VCLGQGTDIVGRRRNKYSGIQEKRGSLERSNMKQHPEGTKQLKVKKLIIGLAPVVEVIRRLK